MNPTSAPLAARLGGGSAADVDAAASGRTMPPVGAPVPAGAMVAELRAVLARLGELTDTAAADTTEAHRAADAARIDGMALLERIQAAAAATQAALAVRFAQSQVAAQQQAVLRDPRAVGRGIAAQLALACRVSPFEGSRRLGVARALHAELRCMARLLQAGRISARVAGLVVTETRHLDPDRRRAVDARLAAELAERAPRRAAGLARRYQPPQPTCPPRWLSSSRSTPSPTPPPVLAPAPRAMPGWDVRLVHDGLGEHPHTVATITPTGHTYTSRAGPAP